MGALCAGSTEDTNRGIKPQVEINESKNLLQKMSEDKNAADLSMGAKPNNSASSTTIQESPEKKERKKTVQFDAEQADENQKKQDERQKNK